MNKIGVIAIPLKLTNLQSALKKFAMNTIARFALVETYFIVWASSFNPLLIRTVDLGAGAEEPIDCLIIQNRQAQSMGKSMD